MYLLDEKSLSRLEIMKSQGNHQLIDWEKTKERFVYKDKSTKVWLFDKKYGWYDIQPRSHSNGNRHRYHQFGSPQEHLQKLIESDTRNLIDWEKTKERFVYTKSNIKVWLFDKKYGWYDIQPDTFNKGTVHKYHKFGSPDEWFDRMKELDKDNQIDWDKSKERFVYKNSNTFVWLYDRIHEWHKIRPCNFVKGARLRNLFDKESGIDLSKPTYLYLLEIENGAQYKIGITNRLTKERYTKSEHKLITKIYDTKFDNGLDANTLEKIVIEMFSDYKITKEEMLLNSGFTETFTGLNIVNELTKYERFKILFE